MKINFLFQKPCNVSKRSAIRNIVALLLDEYNKKLVELSVIFCDDAYLLEINRLFLKHDYYTDIITFDYPEDKSAELYISVDRVKENAITFKSSFQKELHRVIIHGILHIVGFKDNTSKQKNLIRMQEDKYLQLL